MLVEKFKLQESNQVALLCDKETHIVLKKLEKYIHWKLKKIALRLGASNKFQQTFSPFIEFI